MNVIFDLTGDKLCSPRTSNTITHFYLVVKYLFIIYIVFVGTEISLSGVISKIGAFVLEIVHVL
jgi:hypothetical protein